jgi:hypothetical protein
MIPKNLHSYFYNVFYFFVRVHVFYGEEWRRIVFSINLYFTYSTIRVTNLCQTDELSDSNYMWLHFKRQINEVYTGSIRRYFGTQNSTTSLIFGAEKSKEMESTRISVFRITLIICLNNWIGHRQWYTNHANRRKTLYREAQLYLADRVISNQL